MATCETSLKDNDCEEECRTKCFSCGMPACRGCTRIASKYYGWKNKRICVDCQEDRRADIKDGSIVLKPDPRFPGKTVTPESKLIALPKGARRVTNSVLTRGGRIREGWRVRKGEYYVTHRYPGALNIQSVERVTGTPEWIGKEEG